MVAGHVSPRVTIEALPDIVLLYIFDFCRLNIEDSTLDWLLTLYAKDGNTSPLLRSYGDGNQDNIITALENSSRVHEVILNDELLPLKRVIAAMQEPYPVLESLGIEYKAPAALPDTFLGGSTPCLRSLTLKRISFPTLPSLLFSCKLIVRLFLLRLPKNGYISPETMATCVSALAKLTHLEIDFEEYAISYPFPRIPPPLTRAVLPALTSLRFEGYTHYLEDFVA
ncbi:hypothetical protein BGW80DRAFT_1557200 [Lactifluus volemus]|nr:hypothetical protein BGW80DRAFT_1557200 [Lactifluus volemus]